MGQFNSSNVHLGDTIKASDDTPEHLGVVIGYLPGEFGVKANYPTLDDCHFDVDYDEIDEVTHNDDCPPVTPQGVPVPPAPATPVSTPSPVAALSTPELVAQKIIWPGKIVTWSGAGKAKYQENRLFVILNFTKNSGRASINIAPLNGPQGLEPDRFDYYKVRVSDCKPVKFSAPLVKITKAAGA